MTQIVARGLTTLEVCEDEYMPGHWIMSPIRPDFTVEITIIQLEETWILSKVSTEFKSFVETVILDIFQENLLCVGTIERQYKNELFNLTNTRALEFSLVSLKVYNNYPYVVLKPAGQPSRLVEENELSAPNSFNKTVTFYLTVQFTNSIGQKYRSARRGVSFDSNKPYPRQMAIIFTTTGFCVEVDASTMDLTENTLNWTRSENCTLCEIRIPFKDKFLRRIVI
ncbi:4988_t:CDS:2 [Ambispora gerdemannii]|uniref:4988_t:CDS:1 n=1 Tax=Ambispora gerdemannii TaxID=144530 RepID=A0A9N8YQ96_9GLOM|nr:4988_t:CDS:2 [Ambispora gerdemannii]